MNYMNRSEAKLSNVRHRGLWRALLISVMTLLVLTAFPKPLVQGAKLDGIMYLVAVTQMKSDNANKDALDGAKKQQELVKREQNIHAQQERLETQKQFERDAQRFAEISANLKRISQELAKQNCK